MSSIRSQFPVGDNAISAAQFAATLGWSPERVVQMCRKGRIVGARQHPLTKKWWIYPPARLVLR